MTEFVENPGFWPALDKGLMLALGEAAQDIAADGDRAAGRHGGVEARPPSIDSQGPYAVVKIKKGLGTIFNPGAPNRRLKGGGKYPAGTFRGTIQAEHFFDEAVERGIQKGLDLSRYL